MPIKLSTSLLTINWSCTQFWKGKPCFHSEALCWFFSWCLIFMNRLQQVILSIHTYFGLTIQSLGSHRIFLYWSFRQIFDVLWSCLCNKEIFIRFVHLIDIEKTIFSNSSFEGTILYLIDSQHFIWKRNVWFEEWWLFWEDQYWSFSFSWAFYLFPFL